MVTFFDPGLVVFAVEADARILKTAFSLPAIMGCVTAAAELFQTAAHHALHPQMAPTAWRRRGTPSGPGTSPAFPYLFQNAERMGDTNKCSVTKVKTSPTKQKNPSIPGTGYCWCVTEEGKPVPGSSVQHSKVSF